MEYDIFNHLDHIMAFKGSIEKQEPAYGRASS